MTVLSNLYVEKASSEHPLAIWMLNEQLDYVSLLDESQRRFELFASWDLQNCEATNVSSITNVAPFQDSATSEIIGAIPSSATMDIIATSKFTIENNFIDSFGSFNISFYTYIESALADSVSVGYEYYDTDAEEFVTVLEDFPITTADQETWKFITNTFNIPNPLIAEEIKIIIKYVVREGGVPGGYNFLINGLSVGQWSEDFARTSLGMNPDILPNTIDLPSGLYGISAFPYGTTGNTAYYLSSEYEMYARNFGIPLTFGSENTTKLYKNTFNSDVLPSVIFPGKGFLNELGRYEDYTVEMWIRANADTLEPKRFFGPIASDDGLYANGPFLTFKLGKQYASHYVGEWYRPMLIHIRLVTDAVTVLLNGEEVMTLEYDQTTIDLPSEFSEGGKSRDWLGFYVYDDITPIDLDSFSIYSYPIPTIIAKRRWVWGQGVEAPEQTNSAVNAITTFNDYAYSNYAANYNYPDFANWKQAFYTNIEANNKYLSLPRYTLPEFNLDGQTLQSWFDWMQSEQNAETDKYFQFSDEQSLTLTSATGSGTSITYNRSSGGIQSKISVGDSVTIQGFTDGRFNLQSATVTAVPDDNNFTVSVSTSVTGSVAEGTNKQVYYKNTNIFFPIFDMLTEPLESFYGVFETSGTASNEILFKIVDKTSNDYFVVKLTGLVASYIFNTDGQDTVITTKTVTANQKFTIGLHLPSIASQTTPGINKFFVKQKSLSLFVGGDNALQFSGKIYKVGFNSKYNNRLIDDAYASNGVFTHTYDIYDHIANYTLVPLEKFGLFFADIAVSAYWEDYMPLSYFAKYVKDYKGDSFYDLDALQLNYDFPEPTEVTPDESTTAWTYGELKTAYSDPVILTYAALANSFFTGWENYDDMAQNVVNRDFYDNAGKPLRAYVSFQRISNNSNTTLLDFVNRAVPLATGVLNPAATNFAWENTAFEAIPGIVIYPPAVDQNNNSVSINDLAIVYHLEFKSEGIIHQPIRVKTLQLASQVYNRTDFTKIGTKFGNPIYPYTKSGFYYDLKAKNPFTTYKGSTPHLYLSRQSGWRLRGRISRLQDRGLSIPVNLQQADTYEVSSMQMWVRFPEKTFPTSEAKIFSIEHASGAYDFYMTSDTSTKRGKITVLDRDTNASVDNIEFFVNGQRTDIPYLINEEWTVLGLAFPFLLRFNLATGRINLNGPLVYNNISYNLATNLEKNLTLELNQWEDLLLEEGEDTWQYWKDNGVSWGRVKTIREDFEYDINPSDIYKTYTGSNRIVIDDNSEGILIDPEQFTVYNDVEWSIQTKIAV